MEDRVKIVVRGLLELTIGLALTQSSFENFWPWIYCYGVYGMTALRSIFSEQIDLMATIFVVMYIM